MNEAVTKLEPTAVWTHFENLNAVPRPSKREERVIAFMKQFGESLNLETIVDEIGNVIIRKPATAGMENRQGVILQGHLDMVHQKNSDTPFDFETQGIESYIDDDGWLKARGTTLGADNGMGVASIMAVLSSTDLEHGPVEALFTIDEETGMTGAFKLQPGI
ncbi:MAG: dipeptidase D, partial [Mariniblastus sp.]